MAAPLPSSASQKQPSLAMNFHRPSHRVVNASAMRLSKASSVTCTASPSTTTSSPPSHPLHPVVSTTCELERMLMNFCSVAPVEKQTAPSNHTATTGVTWGLPSALTVDTQNSSADSSASLVSSQLVA